MTMKLRILSVLLIFLLVTSTVVAPAASNPLVNPVTVKLVVDGITIVVTSAVAMEIGKQLGNTWDGIAENWDNFVSGLSKDLNNIFSAKKWVSITSGEGRAVMTSLSEGYSSPAGGGKKDDKWYFEARKMFGKIKIKMERMDETQAVEAMKQGKDIMTLDRELAQKVVGRFKGLSKEATDALESQFETHHVGKKGYFPHLHYHSHGKRLHCWSWK